MTEDVLEPYRGQLTGYCYRMLGSAFEAEDAVQETMIRAWRGLDRFEGRSALRSWLYRIATNVCLTMLENRKRRARPMDLTAPGSPDHLPGAPLAETTWVEPVPDALLDPADLAEARESVRLAFVAALQHLPPRQRAVLILREVLSWRASEVAELLRTTVPSVNSALQRARATLAGLPDTTPRRLTPDDENLLARYLEAFEAYDLDALTALLHEEATLSMPPFDLWLRGTGHIRAWLTGHGAGCRGSRLIPTRANGSAAFGQYRPGGEPWALQIIETRDGKVTAINAFLEVKRWFPLFGLPLALSSAA
ncbi:sigma-70 family RNA polymerase sigma factor [Streptomyces harbinensis]|uniref:sigma-70 family RNA polymerase sigma factor n=1 Tax=Streptomyces harbinensis TaxID=1176198 RepID=UPI001591525E|nr:sigma-70 family RNA polymerase sigma factor [Streptomyces harbinensis]QKV69090.1 sigma-70 family RNA polymerase sigma factor [Streptomyces harbinensis]